MGRFFEERRPDWKRFEDLLRRAERTRAPRFSGEEISEFSRLFRAVCYDLSTVRSRDWGQDAERYLNDLVARGHNNFYRSPPGRPREIIHFFTSRFPRLLRDCSGYFWVALGLFVIPGLIAGVLVGRDPSVAGRILPGTVLHTLDEMYSRDSAPGPEERSEAGMAGFYIHNNIGIAFRCFATGIFLGAGTVFFLIFNSIFLGTATAWVISRGHAERFLSFVVGHGAFELTAIVISGAAGLVLGDALIRPGKWSRGESLRRRGLVAVKLAAGAAAMLAVAAVVEAFWSPSALPAGAKYAAGALLWILVIAYLALAGREVPES